MEKEDFDVSIGWVQAWCGWIFGYREFQYNHPERGLEWRRVKYPQITYTITPWHGDGPIWHLRGWCMDKQDVRDFPLSRMTRARKPLPKGGR